MTLNKKLNLLKILLQESQAGQEFFLFYEKSTKRKFIEALKRNKFSSGANEIKISDSSRKNIIELIKSIDCVALNIGDDDSNSTENYKMSGGGTFFLMDDQGKYESILAGLLKCSVLHGIDEAIKRFKISFCNSGTVGKTMVLIDANVSENLRINDNIIIEKLPGSNVTYERQNKNSSISTKSVRNLPKKFKGRGIVTIYNYREPKIFCKKFDYNFTNELRSYLENTFDSKLFFNCLSLVVGKKIDYEYIYSGIHREDILSLGIDGINDSGLKRIYNNAAGDKMSLMFPTETLISKDDIMRGYNFF